MSATLTICFEVCLKYQDELLSVCESYTLLLLFTPTVLPYLRNTFFFLKADWSVDILAGISRFYTVTSVVAIPRFLATAMEQHRRVSQRERIDCHVFFVAFTLIASPLFSGQL